MTKKIRKRRANYFYNGGFSWQKDASFRENMRNAFNSNILNGAIGAAGSMVGQGISGGFSTGVGNVTQGLSTMASSAIPGPWGAVAGAGLNVVGGLVNKLFGSQVNEQAVSNFRNQNAQMANTVLNADNYDSLLSQYSDIALLGDISKSQVGKDGLFSNKVENLTASLNRDRDFANERYLSSVRNSIDNIRTNEMLNANYAAYGGPLTMRYTGTMSPFGNTFADGGNIHIKPENRGKFTRLKERTGKSSTWYKEHGTPEQKKMATFALNVSKWKHADGGPLKKGKYEDWYKTVPADRNDTTSYNLKRAYELAPYDELEAWRTSSIKDLEEGKNHLRSVYLNPNTGVYEFMKSKNHPTLHFETDWYNSNNPEAVKFRKDYDLDMSGDYYKYVPKKKAFGGNLLTNGAVWDNGVIQINSGGSHSTNPMGGVQMGIDPQGVPNLVEEGEAIFNDYVFSDRMKLPKKLKEKYSIKGETFADAAKELSKESKERPNDPISQRGLKTFMSALAESQEELRIKNEVMKENKYSKGGKLGNLFDGTGDKSNRLNSYSNFVPLTDDSFYTPEYMNFWNWYNTNQSTSEGQAWLKRINSGEFGPIGGNTFAPQDIIRLSHDYKKGPVHNAFAAAAKQYTVENPKKNSYTPYTKRWIREKGADGEWKTQQITDEEWNSAPAGRTYLMRNPNLKEGNTITSNRGDRDIYYDVIPEKLSEELTDDVTEVKGIRQNPLRYTPIIGSGMTVLNDIFGGNDPDYSNADMFASAIRSANRPVGTRPIGEYLAYKPFDRMFYINQLNKNAAAGRRAVQNTSGGNRAAALAGILAADYNYGENLGQMARQAEEYNQALKERVTGFNRQTNMFNSEQGTKVDIFNSELLGKQASLYGQLANMRQRILEGNRAEKSTNLTNFIQGLGDLGRELTDRDTLRWLADIGALPYNTKGQYIGGNNTAAPKKGNGGKSKRNKREGYTI